MKNNLERDGGEGSEGYIIDEQSLPVFCFLPFAHTCPLLSIIQDPYLNYYPLPVKVSRGWIDPFYSIKWLQSHQLEQRLVRHQFKHHGRVLRLRLKRAEHDHNQTQGQQVMAVWIF